MYAPSPPMKSVGGEGASSEERMITKKIDKQIKQFHAAKLDRMQDFSQYSHARLGLGHTGGHLKYRNWLDLQAGFSQAKDAVFSQFESQECISLCEQLTLPHLEIKSQINDPVQFILRPDLGRLLDQESVNSIEEYITQHPDVMHRDILLVISGGLSPIAVQHQMQGFLPLLIQNIHHHHWSLAPVMINARGRVALGDQINHYFKAKITIMLIGERPGLSVPDSMGIYFTYNAKPGCTDEQRNCISNIHALGLSSEEAVKKLLYLMSKSIKLKVSGIALKDDEKNSLDYSV